VGFKEQLNDLAYHCPAHRYRSEAVGKTVRGNGQWGFNHTLEFNSGSPFLRGLGGSGVVVPMMGEVLPFVTKAFPSA
jgi:hypothetical protein